MKKPFPLAALLLITTPRDALDGAGASLEAFRDILLEFDWGSELAWAMYSAAVALYLCGWLLLTALRRANRRSRRARGNWR
jgi:hypothetical protein